MRLAIPHLIAGRVLIQREERRKARKEERALRTLSEADYLLGMGGFYLKSISTWFGTKTPSDTIDRIVRDVMDQLGIERDGEAGEAILTTSGGAMQFR